MIYSIFKLTTLFLFKLLYRFKAEGKKKIPVSSPAIIASNHTSYVDPFILAAISPRPVSFMAKEELFRMPLIGMITKRLHAFPVRRGRSDRMAIKKALEVLAQGKALGIFPEGTRCRLEGKLGPVEEGMALLALKTNAPVVPVAIIGSDKIIPEGKKMPRFPRITARVGEVIRPDDILLSEKEKRKKIMDLWVKELNRLLAEGS